MKLNLIKILSILLLVFTFCWNVISQKLSPGFKSNGKTNIEGLLLEKGGSVFLVKSEFSGKNTYNILLSSYDTTNFKKSFEKKISVTTKKGFVVKPLEVITLNDKIYFFYSELNTLTGDNLLYANHVNLSGERVWMRVMDTISHTFSSEKNLEIVTDKNESSLLIVRRYGEGYDDPNLINIRSYDDDLNIKWESNANLPIKQRNLEFKDILYNAENKVYLHSELVYNDPQSNEGKIYKGKRHHIWCYDHEEDLLKEFEVELEDRNINDLKINLYHDKLKVFGIFSYPKDPDFKGVFSLLIDGNFEVINSGLKDFSSAEIHQYVIDNRESDSPKNFFIQDLVTLENGQSFLFIEKIYKTVNDYLDPRTNMYNYVEIYNYNDILVFEFDKDGSFIKIHSIPKMQASKIDNGYYSSFRAVVQKNDLWVFYNDHRSNSDIELSNTKKLRGLSEYRSLAIASLKYDNNSFKKTRYFHDLNNYTPKIIGGEKFGNKMYFFTEKGKKYQLISIELPH